MRAILLIAAVCIAALVGLRRPAFGLMAFTFLGFFNPHGYAWGIGRTFPLSQLVAISTILGMVLSPGQKRLPVQRETILLILLWGAFGVSTFFAIFPDDASKRFTDVSKILLMIGVATIVINSEEKLYSLIRVIGYSLGFYGLKGGAFAIATGGAEMVYGPENSFLNSNNAIGLALVMNIPILLYLLKREQSSKVRWLLKVILVFSYPAIICTYSRGAWLGMVLVTALAVLKSRQRLVLICLACVLGVLALLVGPMIAPDRLEQRYGTLVNYEEDSSAESRFWNWEFCRRVGFAHPLTGGGFNFYRPEMYDRYYPEFKERWPDRTWSCHSVWLTILGEHGFPGAILWLLLIGCCLMSIRQIRAYGRRYSDNSYLVDFADMAQSSMAAYFLVGTFLDAAYFDLFYYFVAFIIVMKGVVVDTASEAVAGVKPAAFGVRAQSQSAGQLEGLAGRKVAGTYLRNLRDS